MTMRIPKDTCSILISTMNPQLDPCFFHVSGQIKNAVAQVPAPTPALRRGHVDLGTPCVGALSTGSGAWPGRVSEGGLWNYIGVQGFTLW